MNISIRDLFESRYLFIKINRENDCIIVIDKLRWTNIINY